MSPAHGQTIAPQPWPPRSGPSAAQLQMEALLRLPNLPADVVGAAHRRMLGRATAGDLRVLADAIEARRIGG